ncbi:integrase family protein [Desulfatiferula olefinivorans]
MARQKLTVARIRGFEYPEKGQIFLWDSDVPGLGVRATPGGKVFVFQSRLDGKTIRIKIGDVRAWTIDSSDPETPGAKQEARRLQALIDRGIDPRTEKTDRIEKEKEKQAKANREAVTLADVWPEYIQSRKGKWGKRHYQDHIEMADPGGKKYKHRKGITKPGPLASLMPLKLSEIVPGTIEAWLRDETIERGARARLAFSLLRAFLRWCDTKPEYKGIAASDACATWLKREYIPKMESKTDCLQREQLAVWFNAVCNIENTVMGFFLQSILLTGARKNELAGLRWNDVDFQWETLIIKDKVSGERTIPLTPYIKSLLLSLPRRNEYVFSSLASTSGRISDPRHPHNRALSRAGIDNLSIHGLRRSFGTLSEWVEVPAGIVAQIMGHKPSATAEKHYKKRPIDLLRMWHVKIEEWILNEAGIKVILPKYQPLKLIQNS